MRLPHGSTHYDGIGYWKYEMAVSAIISNEIRENVRLEKEWLMKKVGGGRKRGKEKGKGKGERETGKEALWNKKVGEKGKKRKEKN